MERAQELATLILKAGVEGATDEEVERAASEVAAVLKSRLVTPDLPGVGETSAVAIEARKTAALMFDRVWSPPSLKDPPPPGIAFHGGTDFELCAQALMLAFGDDPSKMASVARQLSNSPFTEDSRGKPPARVISECLFRERGVVAAPVFESAEARNIEYRPGDAAIVVASLRQVGVVDESRLAWDQVLQFRGDSSAKAKYRRLVHWLDDELVGKPTEYIADEIAQRLEDYEWALQKHGITRALGILESVLDPRFLTGASAFVAAVGLAGSGPAAGAAAATFVVGKITASIARALLDLRDTQRAASPQIAFVHELKRLG